MKPYIPIPRDRELVTLLISGLAVIIGLIWIFFGHKIISFLIPGYSQSTFYYFFSGAIFALTFIGIYGFVRTVLCFTEFMIEQDNLNSLLYENILKDEHEGVFLKNKKGIYKIISPNAQKILGLEGKQVIGFTDEELHTPVSANKIQHEDKRVLEFGETIEWETTKNTTLGTETFICKKYPCLDHRGNVVGIVGSCKNITVLKTFHKLNQQLDGRYHNLFNTLPYPALIIDPGSLQIYTYNDAACKLLGYRHEEFSLMRLSLHVQPEDLAQFKASISDLFNQGGGEFQTRLINKQRDLIDVSGHCQIIHIDDKQYLHVLMYDTTESNRSTQSLISSELKYRSLFEHANDAIIIVSPNSQNIIDANEIAIQSLGFNRDDLLMLSIQDLDATSDHYMTQERIADLEIYNHALYEHRIRNRQGNVISVEINAHKLNYGNEDVYQFVIRNIESRKQTEAALIASEQRYRQMFESNLAIKLVIDPINFKIEDANPTAAEFYGYSIDEMKGMSLSQINVLPRTELETLIQQTREQNLGYYSCPHRLANGQIRFVEVRDGLMQLDGRNLFYSIIHDVTANKEAESQILMASKMFDYSTDAVMLIDADNMVVSVNHAFTSITGYQQSEIHNSPPELILASPDQRLLNNEVIEHINSHGQWRGEIWHRLKTGQSRPLQATINIIQREGANSSYVIMLSHKTTDQYGEGQQTNIIELTQLPNKILFMDRLSNAIERARRNQNRLGVILIDFHKFSKINTEYSYETGDRILIAISKRLKYNTRNTDTVSHFESDNFAILIEDLSDIQQMGIVLQKLMTTLSEDYQSPDGIISMNVSLGVSIYPEDGEHNHTLLEQASDALSRAQQSSESHFEMTNSSMNQLANLWLETEATMHSALRRHEFTLNFMPVIDTTENQVVSVEALVRWNHPEFGELLPQQFLPAAEQSGFIGAIGMAVVTQALKQLRLWLDKNIDIKHMSLNISQSQLDADFFEILTEKCNELNIPHHLVSLEFSEINFIDCTEHQQYFINELYNAGFFLVVDDFGVTHKSLGCILQARVHQLKLHPSLLLNAQQDDHAQRTLQAVLALSEKLDIQLVAEGIETEDEYAYLRSLDITSMQGHYFNQPFDAPTFEQFITHYSNQP